MKRLEPGSYIIAVSGGVDSMVLLDMVRKQPALQLIVAHVDHGIRPNSHLDREFVAHYAARHNLLFEHTVLALGPKASEEQARQARYNFLQKCRIKHKAVAILTAHHQDDLIETAIIMLIRGTGWRGIAPFSDRNDIKRPLLSYTKNQLIGYARKHNIEWRDDPTNYLESYLRNYVRHTVVPLLDQKSDNWQDIFLQQIRKQQHLRRKIETEMSLLLKNYVVAQDKFVTGERYLFIMLPNIVSYELLQQIFRNMMGNSVERDLAVAAQLFIKVARPAKVMPLSATWQLRVTMRQFVVEPSAPVVS